MSPRALAVTLAALACAAALAAWLVVGAQRALLFPGSSALGPPGEVERHGGAAVWLEHAGGRTEAWYLPASRDEERGPLVLFAHGNGELIDHWVREFGPLRELGHSVLLVEYPGYGRSSGRPSQASVGSAMRAAYDWAVQQPGVDASRVIAYGRSLGGGAACLLARDRALAALVLESTFTGVRAFARHLGLPGFLVRDPFDNLGLVGTFAGPILLLHGRRDEVIPVEHAERLHAAAPGSELQLLDCGHNDCARPWSLVAGFLARHGLH